MNILKRFKMSQWTPTRMNRYVGVAALGIVFLAFQNCGQPEYIAPSNFDNTTSVSSADPSAPPPSEPAPVVAPSPTPTAPSATPIPPTPTPTPTPPPPSPPLGQLVLVTPIQIADGATLTLQTGCPTNAVNLVTNSRSTVNCNCQAAWTANGIVYGTIRYASTSSICRAAVHAGFLGPMGGMVSFTLSVPTQGIFVLQAYAGSTMNGVTSLLIMPSTEVDFPTKSFQFNVFFGGAGPGG